MNRISMVGSPAVAEDRVTVPGAAAAVPESGTAVAGLAELRPGAGFAFLLVLAATGIPARRRRALLPRREPAYDARTMLLVPAAPAAHG